MINNSYLLGLYGITTDTGSLIGSNTPAAKPKKTQPFQRVLVMARAMAESDL